MLSTVSTESLYLLTLEHHGKGSKLSGTESCPQTQALPRDLSWVFKCEYKTSLGGGNVYRGTMSKARKGGVGQQRGRKFSSALIQRILLCCLFLKIYLVIWKSELQEGEKQNERISCIYWLTPQLAIFAWAGPVGYQESGVSFKSLTWVAGAQHAGCFLLLFPDHSQRARLKAEQLALEWVFYGIQDRQWEVNLPCHNAIPKSVL